MLYNGGPAAHYYEQVPGAPPGTLQEIDYYTKYPNMKAKEQKARSYSEGRADVARDNWENQPWESGEPGCTGAP